MYVQQKEKYSTPYNKVELFKNNSLEGVESPTTTISNCQAIGSCNSKMGPFILSGKTKMEKQYGWCSRTVHKPTSLTCRGKAPVRPR